MNRVYSRFVWKLIPVFFLLAFSLSACRKDELNVPEPIPEPEPEPVEYTEGVSVRGLKVDTDTEKIDMPNNVIFVKEDINSDLVTYNPKNGTITFKDGEAIEKAGIKVGDVLYSMPVDELAPEGYILKVTGIQERNGKVTYEVEEAGISDAFEHIDTSIPIEMNRLSESDFTIWDPFQQEDQTERLLQLASGRKTRADWDFLNFSGQWGLMDKERYNLTINEEKTSLDIVLFDIDENYKTKYDQIILTLTLSYDANLGSFDYSFNKSKLLLAVDFTPKVGVSAGLSVLKVKSSIAEAQGERPGLKEKRALLDELTKKLIGKRFCVASIDIPVGPASIFVDPRFEIYLLFNLGIDGELSVECGVEKVPIHLHAENIPFTPYTNYLKSLPKVEGSPKMYSKVETDLDVSLKAGLGIGAFCQMPKIAKIITDDKDVMPYIGFFVDATVNGKASLKGEKDIGSNITTFHLHTEAYGEIEGYFELYAHFKNDLIWHDKLTIAKMRLPKEEDNKFSWDSTYVKKETEPIPFALFPNHRSVVNIEDGDPVTLKWDIPDQYVIDHQDNNQYDPFKGLSYTIYLGTDKVLVAQSSPKVRIAQGVLGKSTYLPLDSNVTYYWKIVCTNSEGLDYESSIYSFDTGSEGTVKLNGPLARYLNNHYEVLEGVYIHEDGTINLSPSNIKALNSITTLKINDPEGKYGISYLDDLLMLLPSLRELDCSHNNLQSLYLVENPLLESLVCQDNPLNSLPLEYTPKLEALNCQNNPQLKELDVESCPNLKTLNCSSCGLETLVFVHNQKLMSLYASSAHLTYLDVSRCPILFHLDFHDQQQERVTLRLTREQRGQFALFEPHDNTDYEYVELSEIETEEATDITNHSAVIKVSALGKGPYQYVGLLYSHWTSAPDHYTDYTEKMTAKDKLYATFTLENLHPDTDYYARGYSISGEGKAVYGNVVHFKTAPADPAPQLKIDPEEYEFGPVDVGDYDTKNITITNTGTLDLVYEIISPASGPFTASAKGRRTLKPTKSDVIKISFAPREVGSFNGEFIFRSNDPRGDLSFYVLGTGGGEVVSNYIPEIVDMGLSVHWASFNLGATRPEGLGFKFAWGETGTWRNHGEVENPWEYYRWASTYDPDNPRLIYKLTKYNEEDEKTELDPDDDAAYVNLGVHWRMPTIEEWRELVNNCDITGDSNIVKATSRVNGNYIYVPFSSYWTQSVDIYNMSIVETVSVEDNNIKTKYCYAERWEGLAIRPIFFIPIESISLEPEIEVSNFESSKVVKVSVLPADATYKHFSWSIDDNSLDQNYYNNILGKTGEEITVTYGGTYVGWDGKNGTAIVTCSTDGGRNPAKTASCKVVYKTYIEEATIYIQLDSAGLPDSISELTLIPGESINVKPFYSPQNASEHIDHPVWKSDDPSIATVVNGKVTGVKEGTTTIRLVYESWHNTFVEATCQIIVSNPEDYNHEGYIGEHWD